MPTILTYSVRISVSFVNVLILIGKLFYVDPGAVWLGWAYSVIFKLGTVLYCKLYPSLIATTFKLE